jgi:GntR family transcriptional regulator
MIRSGAAQHPSKEDDRAKVGRCHRSQLLGPRDFGWGPSTGLFRRGFLMAGVRASSNTSPGAGGKLGVPNGGEPLATEAGVGVVGAGVWGTIDRTSPVQYYHQLKELLREEIGSGHWKVGTRIPSEPELCRLLDVSRTVVRQALGDLEHEGLLRRRKGLGTFVAEPKIRERLVQSLTGFHDDMVAQGRTPRTRVLDQRVMTAPAHVARELGVPVGHPVVMIERVRFVDTEPIALVTTYLPHALVPGLERIDFTDRSLYQTLSTRFGLELDRGRRLLESVAARDLDAELLDVEPGDPLLFLRSVTYLPDGRAIEYYEARHRGDRTVLEVELVRQPPI